MDDIEVRLLQWEADLEQFEIYEPNKLGETIKMGILKDMVPETVRQVIRQQKPSTFDKLKQVLEDEAKEHRDVMNAKKLRSKGLHVAEGERWAPRPEDSPNDQLDDPLFVWNEQLNSFVPASAEADEQTFAWDTNLYTFVPSKGKGKGKGKGRQTKGGGKGSGWQQKGGGKGKGYGSSGGDWGKGGKGTFQPRAPGTPPPFFDGDCNHCHIHGHQKRDCPVLDKEMAARRAQMAGGNTGAPSQSSGTGRAMEVSADAWYTRHAAPSVSSSRPTGMFSLFPEAFGHDGDTDSEMEFPSLSTAPGARKKTNHSSVESWIPEGDDLEMDEIELLMNERRTEAIIDIGDAVKVVEGKG
jgi:hypothetical protein